MCFQVRNLCMAQLSFIFWLHMATDGIIQSAGYSWSLFGAGSFIALSPYFCHSILPLSSWLVWDVGFSRALDFIHGGIGPREEKWKPCSSWHPDMKSFGIISIPFYLKSWSQSQLRFKESVNGPCLSVGGIGKY